MRKDLMATPRPAGKKRRLACTKDGDLWSHAQKMLRSKGPESVEAKR